MKRGWIYLGDGIFEEVPLWALDHKRITWPPTLHLKEPGQPVHYFGPEDAFTRFEVVPEEAYVFLREVEALKQVPDEIVAQVKRLMQEPYA